MDNLDLQYINKVFDKFYLNSDFEIRLQTSTQTFQYEKWKQSFHEIPQNIVRYKFIYIIFKPKNNTISCIYIGKSATKNLNRLMQHAKGLKVILESEDTPQNKFYERFFDSLFKIDNTCPIYLLIFKWNKTRIIKNILPFDLEVNLANAEAILISILSSMFKDALLNHEFITRTKWANKKISLKNLDRTIHIDINGTDTDSLWNEWCDKWFFTSKQAPTYKSEDEYTHIPLFKTNNDQNIVDTFNTRSGKRILKKDPLMMQRITNSVKIVKNSYDFYSKLESSRINNNLNPPPFTDGLIYCIYVLKSDIKSLPEYSEIDFKSNYIPIYIGKTEALGRNGGYSANLKGVDFGKNHQYFARWGNDDARHIGGLSLRFFRVPNAYPSTDYEAWISIIFDANDRDRKIPKLRIPVYFQMKPWYPFNISISSNIGIFTPELETLLIAICRNIFPTVLVNKKNR